MKKLFISLAALCSMTAAWAAADDYPGSAGTASELTWTMPYEGGQMTIQRRLPKFGFTNPTRVEYKAINVAVLQTLAEANNLTVINIDTLREAGFINKNQLVKVLGNGELTAKLEVSANAFSKSAIAKIEAVGGTATTI